MLSPFQISSHQLIDANSTEEIPINKMPSCCGWKRYNVGTLFAGIQKAMDRILHHLDPAESSVTQPPRSDVVLIEQPHYVMIIRTSPYSPQKIQLVL